MEIKRLIPEQVAYMEKRLKELESKAKKTEEELGRIGISSDQFDKIIGEIKELRSTLRMARVVSEYDESKIDIGTRFSATLDFGNDDHSTEKYILVDAIHTTEIEGLIQVQVASPFGKAVYHKGLNEEFSYTTPRGKLVNGVIEKIIPNITMTEKQKTK